MYTKENENSWEEGYVACSRCSDGQMVGIEIICTRQIQKKNTREKMRGDCGGSEGIVNFLPTPN